MLRCFGAGEHNSHTEMHRKDGDRRGRAARMRTEITRCGTLCDADDADDVHDRITKKRACARASCDPVRRKVGGGSLRNVRPSNWPRRRSNR